MKVTFQGFRLEAGDGFTLPEFGKVLVAAAGEGIEHDFNDHKRLFLFEEESDPDFYTGLLITAKDQKTFPELRNEKGKLAIKVSALARNSRLMDFNFFVLNKTTFCGLYQHYHASCSAAQFGVFLRYHFWKPEQEARIAARTKAFIQDGLAAHIAEERAKKGFYRLLKFELFFKPEDFEKILRTMAEIKRFQFDVSTKTAKQRQFTPGIFLKKRQETVVFETTNLVDKLAGAIASYVRKHDLKRGKAIAVDPAGEEMPVYLTRNVDGFGEFGFDETVAQIATDDLGQYFTKSALIQNLLAAARAHHNLFMVMEND